MTNDNVKWSTNLLNHVQLFMKELEWIMIDSMKIKYKIKYPLIVFQFSTRIETPNSNDLIVKDINV